jgi:hypothetical protein
MISSLIALSCAAIAHTDRVKHLHRRYRNLSAAHTSSRAVSLDPSYGHGRIRSYAPRQRGLGGIASARRVAFSVIDMLSCTARAEVCG